MQPIKPKPLWPEIGRYALAMGLTVGYVALIGIQGSEGVRYTPLVGIPAIVIAWFWGLRGAIAGGILLALLNEGLFLMIGRYAEVGGWSAYHLPGVLALFAVALTVGWLRRIKERLDREFKARAESEQSLRTAFDASEEGLHVVDLATGEFLEVNDAMCRMFGYTREELLRLPPAILCPPESRDAQNAALREMFGGESGVASVRVVQQRKDGTFFHALMSCHRIVWQGKQAIYGSIRDISELVGYQEALERKNREIIDFANTMTHELRNPITSLKMVCSTMQSDLQGNVSDEIQELMDLGVEALGYSEQLLNELLECARLDSGTNQLTRERFDISEAVAEVSRRFGGQTQKRNITVHENTAGTVWADRRAVVHILQNLVGNAVKYMHDCPDPHVHIDSVEREGCQWISVRDNGPGIPRADQETVFERFRRGGNVGELKGSGLGLSIAKGFVEAHGGKIWLESSEGRGTTFTFTLPAQA